ncbi:MAG TPA: ABC transporter permease [Telluria sp.]|nr:ABC transporter permease [Telluria sp.]
MLSYYFMLGVRSLRRNPALTALMVLTLAIGVAASVATLTILHVMSSNPIPQKSERLFVPLIDNGPLEGYNPADSSHDFDQMSYIDASNLLKGGFGERRTALYGIGPEIEPARKDLPVISAQGVAPTRDFFAMFDVPFLYGQAWSEADDKAGADVVVLSRAMSEKLFGGGVNPVGQRIRMMGFDFQVIGVLQDWLPLPKFYRLIGGPGAFGQQEDVMIPFSSAIRHETQHNGGMSCSSRRDPGWQ